MIDEFDDEMARTRKILAAVPADRVAWKLDPKTQSIGWNANHIAEIVGWTSDILSQSEFDLAPVDGPAYKTPEIEDPKHIVENFDSAVATARAALLNASAETLAEDWTMKMGGQPLFTMTKGACIRRWVLNHTVHHRAIVSLYLRHCGVELTPVYDE